MSTWGSGPTQFFFALGQEEVLRAMEVLGYQVTGFCYPLNSYENRVYEIELESRAKIVAKFYRPGRWSRAQILEEHAFIADLQNAEIPVSAPVKIQGETLFRLPDQDLWYCVYEKHRGRMLGEVPGSAYRSLGTWIARLHNVGSSGVFRERPSLSLETYGRAGLDTVLSSPLFPSEMRPTYEPLVRELLATIEARFAGVPVHRIHGDCHLGNILWNDFEPLFVDFDDSLRGPAVQDLWLLLPGRDEHAVNMLREVAAGYASLRDWQPSWSRLIEPLRALRLIHFQAWVLRRWEDPAFPRAFPQMLTPVHWREHYTDLQEILLMIKGIESEPWVDI
ncbi:MAG TPA: serine/threonine protein kinase [Bdellovibrionota bacterium]|nr:serine/threonine protein kinase [Bdellovibrionota bacterium]